MNVTITVNGKRIQADVPAGQTLLQFLREQGYRSVKCGCETTNCGLCSVWMDEKTVLSCSVPVGRADGHRIPRWRVWKKRQRNLRILWQKRGRSNVDSVHRE